MRLPAMILDFDDLIDQGPFPIHPDTPGRPYNYYEEEDDDDEWYDTEDLGKGRCRSYYTLDCEMVQTRKGRKVGRVSLIDFEGDVVLDEYVKPYAYITNYLTRWSDDILIGHAIYNDLNVLKLRHPKIIDTAELYEYDAPNPNGQVGLKQLARDYLGWNIQMGPHDSVEDARATLALVELKLPKRRRRFLRESTTFERKIDWF
ncbi:unnamed protein product [Wickerhamomyces anomalus]